MKIGDFLQSTLAVDINEVSKILDKALADLGYSAFIYSSIRHKLITPKHINCPAHWQEEYFSLQYGRYDPVIDHILSQANPFTWDQVRPKDKLQKMVMDAACDAGLRNGVVIPIRTPGGQFLISAATEEKNPSQSSFWQVYTMASHFHLLSERQMVSDALQADLSDRERDCLTWSGSGKSSWDISKILSISESTVNFHIYNAMKKLETSSRVVAIVKAVQLGVIQP